MTHLKIPLAILTLIAMALVASCGAPAVRVVPLESAGGISGAGSSTASPTPTAISAPAAAAANTASTTTAPDSSGLLTELPASADPSQGDQIFHKFNPITGMACATCHRTDSEERLIGPGLLHVGQRAATRVNGLTAIAYIYQSIIDPSAYVVDGYPDIMPKNWAKALTQAQIENVIAYLLSLK